VDLFRNFGYTYDVLSQMLKHGRAGVPMEVMGLMLGEFVDDYTVQVIDVFAMPQSGTSVTVESVDHVFQQKMVDMLKQTGRCVLVTSGNIEQGTADSLFKTRNGRWMVPFTSRLRVLAVERGHQHATGTSSVNH
jgi:hypothetical protein